MKVDPGQWVSVAYTGPCGKTTNNRALVINVNDSKVRLEVDLGGHHGRLWTTLDIECINEVLKEPRIPKDQLTTR